MRTIPAKKIKDAVARLCVEANTVLRPDIRAALARAARIETNKKARSILKILLENAEIARSKKIGICQDTGMVIVDIELGQDVRVSGGGLNDAVNRGVIEGYKKGYFRESMVKDPLFRDGRLMAGPAALHVSIVPGRKIKITVSPKGFGSENKTRIKMFNPTESIGTVKAFILDTVRTAGPNACPPFVIGVGIGGTSETAAYLAKKALTRQVTARNPDARYQKLEQELLREINRSNIGPMGLGGKTTCLGVNIIQHPTHIAGLPVAVNVGCHATRSAGVTI